MKKIGNWIKGTYNKAWEVFLKNYATVCVGLVLTCIYFSLTIAKDLKHAEREFGLLKDNLTLGVELRESVSALKGQSEFINFQTEVMDAQRKALEKQEITIEDQGGLLQRLVGYLKSIGHWPPKPQPPIDRDKWIIDNGSKEGSGSL